MTEEQYPDYDYVQVHCPDCAGQGRLPCPECGGHGTSSFTTDGMCPVCFGQRHMNCLTCHGDGFIVEQVESS